MGRTTQASQDGIARSWEQEVGVEEAGRVRKDVGKVIRIALGGHRVKQP